jgi:hypothetical protein
MLGNVNLHKELEQELNIEASSSSSSSSSERVTFIARIAATHCGIPLSPSQVLSLFSKIKIMNPLQS